MSRPEEEEVLFAYIARSTKTSLLCEQVITRSRGSLFAFREGYFCFGTCYTETPSLFLSSHDYGFNLTSSSIIAPKG